MTHEVAGKTETSPLWRELDAVRADPAEVRRFLERLPMAERLAVYGELDAGAYAFNGLLLPPDFPGIDELRDEGREWAPRHADWLLERAKTLPQYDLGQHLGIRLPLFLSFARSRIPVEQRWEVFLPVLVERPEVLRECLDALPGPRWVPAVRASLPAHLAPEMALKTLVPLMETLELPGLMDLAFDWHLGFNAPKKETLATLAEVVTRHPALAESLAVNRKKKPLKLAVEARPRPSEAALTSVQKEQIARLEEGELDQLHFFLVSYAKGAPAYDVVLLADSDGAAFRTGTSEVVAIVAQEGADGEDAALCFALDQAFEAYRKKAKAKSSGKTKR